MTYPDWIRNITANLPVTAQYVVHGNIRDHHLVASGALTTPQVIAEALREQGFECVLYHSPMTGLQVFGPEDVAEKVLDGVAPLGKHIDYQRLGKVLTRVTMPDSTTALIVDYVSQHRSGRREPTDELHEFMLDCLREVHSGQQHPIADGGPRFYRPVIWLVDVPADLPTWMVSGSDGIRQVSVPFPDVDARIGVARALGFREEQTAAFADASAGLTVRAMQAIRGLADHSGANRIEDAVRAYRLGLTDNPWKRPELRRRIVGEDGSGDAETVLGQRVLGQPRAVRHATDILVRATMGLAGAWQGSRSSGPRGVLFFAGPTGVGKTELAKAITALVFGDESAYTRFDMSEFSAEHTEARLIGAPPGYVGHGRSGELTDAVRRKPFSLILFDEIEKAHPLVMDKFLQILSDGRLTDGMGATVDFSETIIVFTSNVGVADLPINSVPDPAEFEARLLGAVESHFRHVLQRPELLGRIGDNIVAFHYLTDEVGRSLVGRYLDNIRQRTREEHDMALEIPAVVIEWIADRCIADMSLGGRGIGQTLDTVFVNPLGRALIQHDSAIAVVDAVSEHDGLYEVTLR
ncbi:chaperone [Nocardioides baekrokdamisoli]|uniref:Chaperone n=1 Tax=Nocardioides baekrokdamisoli TaxID=1804624 RepID=A0A3G9IDE8_9ACTN|nr:AAA family ATPase [Nocardioides baekrokdamisoli]BBH17000.1 chaperone [Nocardioides baekrokdamisoli]